MKKIIFFFLSFFSGFLCSAQKIQYGVEVGYGLNKVNSEVKIYDEYLYKKRYENIPMGSKVFYDYPGIWHTDGGVFQLKAFIAYTPIKHIRFCTGAGINVSRGKFIEYESNHEFPYDYSYYKLSYLTIPLEVVLLDNCWIKPYAALNSGLRVATSKNMRDTFSAWEEKSNSDSFKLQTRRCKFDYELGVKLQIWKAELSISRYKGITPFIVVPDFYENKPDGSINPSEGETAHYNSGFQFKLSIPIGEFELK